MIHFLSDTSPDRDGWIDIFEHFNESHDSVIKNFWAFARTHQDMPNLSNLYQSALLLKRTELIQENHPDAKTEYFINCMDSHFYVNQCSVDGVPSLLSALTAH